MKTLTTPAAVKSLITDAKSLDEANRSADYIDDMAIGTRGTTRTRLSIVATALRLHGQAIESARLGETSEAARNANGRDQALLALGVC